MLLIPSYFIDSWEVETQYLWTEGLEEDFKQKYGYDIVPFMEKIYEPEKADHLYDYMALLSDKVIEFYRTFDSYLNANGVFFLRTMRWCTSFNSPLLRKNGCSCFN